ncbi:MAG: carboxypeptidase regulatory-like domain-containing protein [Pirellulales bacterium]|nr:carboxypeptidase regulatory-like domain-containing protein [Pirellulales bacterium]
MHPFFLFSRRAPLITSVMMTLVLDLYGQTLGVYHNYTETTATLQTYATLYPDLLELGSLGHSVLGSEIWYARISDHLESEEDEPEVRYISTMHGDEPVGTELCLYFIDYLLGSYGTDPRITDLIDNTDITIVPLMNPDGRDAQVRWNAQHLDLNRTFPEGALVDIGNLLDGPPMDTSGRPPEVVHIMEWGAANRFTLSANFHTGALVVNYPYDNDNLGSVHSPTPDDALFIHLAETYSSHNGPMWNSPWFHHGITNGADWYAIDGGMQDWSYRYLGDNHVTIELSDIKWPSEGSLPSLWDNNRESMLSYLESVHMGIRGIMTDATTGLPLEGTVRVAGNEQAVFSDPDVGDYHRMLLPGTYDLTFTALGYEPVTIYDVVVTSGAATRIDIQLESIPVYLEADFDEDGDVDGSDFLTWQCGFGLQAGGLHCDGDADADTDVDRADFLLWQSQFGSFEESQILGPPIPEPASGILLLAHLAVFLVRGRFSVHGPIIV